MTDAPYATTAEAARQIGVGVSTLQRWAAEGIVTPAWRTPGGQARWDVSDLRAQLRMPGSPLREASGDEPGVPGAGGEGAAGLPD
ncbi:MAG: MerR family DNA-binding transcriptional regulator [Streptosporangiaceae bacterium]